MLLVVPCEKTRSSAWRAGCSANFTWNPMQQGSYDIQVTVKDSFSAATGESATAS